MTQTLAIAGLGAIGYKLAQMIDAGTVEDLRLTAVSANNKERASERVASFVSPPKVCGLSELAEHADIVVECAPAARKQQGPGRKRYFDTFQKCGQIRVASPSPFRAGDAML